MALPSSFSLPGLHTAHCNSWDGKSALSFMCASSVEPDNSFTPRSASSGLATFALTVDVPPLWFHWHADLAGSPLNKLRCQHCELHQEADAFNTLVDSTATAESPLHDEFHLGTPLLVLGKSPRQTLVAISLHVSLQPLTASSLAFLLSYYLSRSQWRRHVSDLLPN